MRGPVPCPYCGSEDVAVERLPVPPGEDVMTKPEDEWPTVPGLARCRSCEQRIRDSGYEPVEVASYGQQFVRWVPGSPIG